MKTMYGTMFRPCEVVLLPFPFSDLRSAKRRPALVLQNLPRYGDVIALAITSRSDQPAGELLAPGDFEFGSLPKPSWVRCDQLHTFDRLLIIGRIGKLKPEAFIRILKVVCGSLGCPDIM